MPRGGGLVGAGVEAAGGVDGAAPPPPNDPTPKAEVDEEEEAAAVPVPKTVVVLLPQVTMVAICGCLFGGLCGAERRRSINGTNKKSVRKIEIDPNHRNILQNDIHRSEQIEIDPNHRNSLEIDPKK